MTMDKVHITNLISETIRSKNANTEIILFGSQARENSNPDSDWDILILLEMPTVSRFLEKDYKDALYNVELEIGQPISTFVFSKADWEGKHKFTPFYNNIKRDGIYLA